jgi:RES domain-containing protein
MAAPFEAVMPAIYKGIQYYYSDEATAGAPMSSEFSLEYVTSADVVARVADAQGVEWPEQMQADIVDALHLDGWVDAAEGDWNASHGHEELHYSWSSFARAVKHRSRFHFSSRSSRAFGGEVVDVPRMLPFLGRAVSGQRMLRKLPAESVVYRVREGWHAGTVEALGPPPAQVSKAGRMNPAGIPYFYLSLSEATAIKEARATAGMAVTVGEWSLASDLYVLDLTKLRAAPSIFSGEWSAYNFAVFLFMFTEEISKPVAHDGTEHIEYVPTQVLCEYFAQAFTYAKGRTLGGIVFPSAVHKGSSNLVLFPRWGYGEEPEWKGVIKLVGSRQLSAP